jgi:endogenous inhibitor of DNA gyrase (YacG/DUF329 family)
MSQKVKATVTCPQCGQSVDTTLFRTIWGEYPENRDLVMSDKINCTTCPKCNTTTKWQFPFMYTNTPQGFAVWWEPTIDPQIDKDSKGFAQMMGKSNHLATAPRIKDWEEFKETIVKFETGELKANSKTIISQEMKNQMDGFLKHMQNQPQKKSGCLGILLFLIVTSMSVLYLI